MATLALNAATLVDWAKRQDPDGKTARIAEMLNQSNRILDDMLWIEGNLPTGHRTTMRTALPTVSTRQLNVGTTPSKSTTKQSDEQAAIFDAWSEVDRDLADLGGNTASYRLSESASFLEAMNQKMAQTLFYGNSGTDQTTFTGFAPRFASSTASTSANLIKATASPSGSDQTSLWLVVWGENTVCGFFPKGSHAGLEHQDKGIVTAETVAGIGQTRLDVYRDHFIWKAGLAVRDWRFVVRAANVDTSALVAQSGNADLITVMSRMIDRIPYLGAGRAAFYMSRTPQSWLRVQALGKSNNALSVSDSLNQFGQRINNLEFLGIPIHTCDQISEAEAIVA